MLDVILRTLEIREDEVLKLEELIVMPIDQFLTTISHVKDEFVDPVVEIACVSHVLSHAPEASKFKLSALASHLGQTVEEDRLRRLKRELSVR